MTCFLLENKEHVVPQCLKRGKKVMLALTHSFAPGALINGNQSLFSLSKQPTPHVHPDGLWIVGKHSCVHPFVQLSSATSGLLLRFHLWEGSAENQKQQAVYRYVTASLEPLDQALRDTKVSHNLLSAKGEPTKLVV